MAAAGPGSLELDSPAPWVCWILAGLLAGQSWAWNLSLDTGHLRDSSLGPTIQPVTTSQKQDIWKVPFQDFRPLSPFISPFHSLFPWGVCVCVCVCVCACVCWQWLCKLDRIQPLSNRAVSLGLNFSNS